MPWASPSCSSLWIGLLLVEGRSALIVGFLLLVVRELLVPVVRGTSRGITPFHPHHIAERYGLLTIIVLGE